MRRVVAAITAVLLVSLVASVAVATETGTYRDQFSNLGYSGNDGNLHWSTNWTEFGESDGHAKGKVRVVADDACSQGNNCLAISGGGLELNNVGAGRGADLARFDSAKLSFKMSVVVDEILTTALLSVEASPNGTTWLPLETYVLTGGESQRTVPLTSLHMTSGFALRFLVTGLLAGDVYIDDVRVEGPLTASSTTTSTTSSTTTSSSTTSSSTTSTTSSTTTSSSTTSTTSSSTSTTSTTSPSSDSSRSTDGDGTTSTTADGDASTSEDQGALTATGEPPTDGGIREPAVGIQADFARGMFGDVTGERPEVLGVELEANYTMAVEVIESSWVWILGLALLIATAIVSGLDRRRSNLPE